MDDLVRLLRDPGPLLFDDTEDLGSYSVRRVSQLNNGITNDSEDVNLHDLEFKITISELQFPKNVEKQIFSYFSANDIKTSRLVCKKWNKCSSPYLDKKTELVFNGEDSPWAFFTPAITQICMNYLKESKIQFTLWTSMKIYCGSTSQIEPLLSNGFSEIFRHSLRRIKSLHLQNCFLDWDIFCRLLNHFPSLENLFEDQNIYYEKVSFLTQIITSITVPLSPTISSSGITELDFINKFQKYNASLQIKKLKIQDSGIGNHTNYLLQLLCKIIVDNSLIDFTIIMGGINNNHHSGYGSNGGSSSLSQTSSSSLIKIHGLQLWITIGDFIVFTKKSLKKLTIYCTHEKSPVNSFDLFVTNCIETINNSNGKLYLEHLILDFKFLWLSHPTIQTELIPFIKSLQQLKTFYIKTIIMKPSWVHRLELLKPCVPNCFFDIGVHVTDIEGESNLLPIIQLMHSNLYQIFMSTLHVSIITQDVLELGQMISTDPDVEYTNVKKFKLTVMNVSFLDFSIDIIIKNYPNLTVLELIDGPLIHKSSSSSSTSTINTTTNNINNINDGDENGFEQQILGNTNIIKRQTTPHTIKEHGVSQYGNMSHALFDDEHMQVVLKTLTKLKVLSLQCNMNGLSDVGMTGLSAKTCGLLKRRGSMSACVVDLEYDLVGHSLVNLKDLRKLTLRGLGKLLTDVSVNYGFLKLTKLEQLILYGTLELSSPAKTRLCKRLGDKRCQIEIHMQY